MELLNFRFIFTDPQSIIKQLPWLMKKQCIHRIEENKSFSPGITELQESRLISPIGICMTQFKMWQTVGIRPGLHNEIAGAFALSACILGRL